MTCSLTKNLEREIKNVLTKDEYCAYDNFLGIVYHKVKDDKRNGSTLNEHAFKDFMMFYCFLMYRILSFSVDVNLSKLKVSIRSKSRTKTLKGGGPIKSLKGLIYFTFIYFLLSGFGFYESIRNVRDAKRIPENMRGHKEFFDLESEFSGKDAVEAIKLFMQKSLSTLVNKNYIESLYDATYASGEVCIPDFNLIFSQDNLNVLVDEIKVLSVHGAEVKALYPKKFKRPEIPFYDVPKNIVNRARTAKKKFDSRNDSDVDVWVEDGFGFVTQYDGSCMSGEILKREAVARTKKGRDTEAYHRKLENWMDRIRRASSSLRMRFYNMMATAGVISFFIYVLIQTQNEQEKRQREGNALNLDENDIHKLKNVSNRTLSRGYNYLSNKWSKTKRIASKVGHAFKEDIMELTRPRHGPIVSVKDTKEYIDFEKSLLNHPRLCDYIKVNDENVLFAFDFCDLEDDWSCFIDGKYSLISMSVKRKILDFFDKRSSNFMYIQSFLYPHKWFNEYASLLEVDVDMLKAVGELCDKPNLEKEKLILVVENLENIKIMN